MTRFQFLEKIKGSWN